MMKHEDNTMNRRGFIGSAIAAVAGVGAALVTRKAKAVPVAEPAADAEIDHHVRMINGMFVTRVQTVQVLGYAAHSVQAGDVVMIHYGHGPADAIQCRVVGNHDPNGTPPR